MSDVRKIIHIETPDLNNLTAKQLGVQTNVDSDLGFRMWGGKDGAGYVTRWLSKDQAARVTSLTISGITGSSGILKHSSTGVVSGEASINALSDVTVSSPENDHFLIYNSTSEKWENVAFTIDRIDDIVIDTPEDGQVLVYSASSEKWENSFSYLSFDAVYNNQEGIDREISVDDGNVIWTLTDYDFVINLPDEPDISDSMTGFFIEVENGDYFRLYRYNNEGTNETILDLDTDDESNNIRVSFTVSQFVLNSDYTNINGLVSDIYIYAPSGHTVIFGGYSVGNLYLQDSGNTNLSLFSASSIIGALNELKTGNIVVAVDTKFAFGTNNIKFEVDSGQTASNTFLIGINDSTRIALICQQSDMGFDFGHSAASSPTLFIHSHNQSTSQWISLTHSGTQGVIACGTSSLYLGSTTCAPRAANMTSAQIVAISSPLDGMIVYNTTTNKLQARASSSWVDLH